MSGRRIDEDSKFQTKQTVTGTGLIGISEYKTKIEASLRTTIVGAGGTNVIEVQAKIPNQNAWTIIETITGNDSVVTDITTWDFIRFICTTFDGSPELTAAGFFEVSPENSSVGLATEAKQDDIINLLDDIANGGVEGSVTYGEISGIAASTETTVVSKTITAGFKGRLKNAWATGSSCAVFKLKVNGSTVGTRRINWCDRNAEWVYKDLELSAGDVIIITAEHTESATQEFEADLHWSEDDT
jgi:hypothetical protein